MNNKTIKLQIWDTAGQERFRTVTSSYYRGSHGIVIVFDVTDKESFEHVKKWFEEIDRYASDKVSKILVGNKIDLDERVISRNDADIFASQHGMEYIETSAKENINVNLMFRTIVNNIKYQMTHDNPYIMHQSIRLHKDERPGWYDKCC